MITQAKKKILTRISLRNFRILFGNSKFYLGNSKFPNIKNPPTPKNLATSRCEAKKVAPRKCGCETKIGILVLGILEFLGNFAQEF